MSFFDTRYDVAIIGGGIGGTTLAAILARNGVRVALVEGAAHPRFTIGESTIPETTFGFRVLARRYGVPELEYLATNGELRARVSAASGVKRNFSFVAHREGERMRATECTQYPTFGPPLGPDSHYFRQDVDAFLYHTAIRYGAAARTGTLITGAKFDGDGAELTTKDGDVLRASYVVDAGGIRAALPEMLGLRQEPPYRTRTRSIFSHFTGVTPFDAVAPRRREHGLPSAFSEGTLHHLFDGGWIWVIPFDNHADSINPLCSVGVNLDIDKFPPREGVSPQDEFWEIVGRFPDVAQQLRGARAVRPYLASRRNQFSSTSVIGDRWCLMPHASEFIDPLFSSGLAVTVMALNALAHRLIDAVRSDDFATERFEYLQTWVRRMFAYYDDLVGCSYVSFGDFELWNAWMRVWTIGTLYGVNAQNQAALDFERTKDPTVFHRLEQPPFRGLQAVDNPAFAKLFATAVAAVRGYESGELTTAQAVPRIFAALRESGLCPDVWGTLDPRNRCPSGTFTLLPLWRLLMWGRYQSPDGVRGRYFTGGTGVVANEALRTALRTGKRSARRFGHVLRDMSYSWTGDWTRRPPEPTALPRPSGQPEPGRQQEPTALPRPGGSPEPTALARPSGSGPGRPPEPS